MLKMLLGKEFNIEAIPVAVAMGAGVVLVTLQSANGSMYEMHIAQDKVKPSESKLTVRHGVQTDAR